jgi:hypothetical protein
MKTADDEPQSRLYRQRRVCSTECACGLAFPSPWELIGHFLAVYPPDADQPLDDIRHADVTRLTVKLDEGPSEVWEFVTRARDPRKHLRVAASIAMRSATGDLEPWAEITHKDVRDTYRVSAYAAREAIGELQATGILGHYGGRNNVEARDIIDGYNRTHRAARTLNLIIAHLTALEADVSALTTTHSVLRTRNSASTVIIDDIEMEPRAESRTSWSLSSLQQPAFEELREPGSVLRVGLVPLDRLDVLGLTTRISSKPSPASA